MVRKVIVLGSINIDLVISVDRLPKIGETILGNQIDYMIGGKGSNQAVACSRIGRPVTMLGKVGKDTFGNTLLEHLSREKVITDRIVQESSLFSGMASIFKYQGNNSIVVIAGANEVVDSEYLRKNLDVFNKGDVLLCQLEIPIDTVKEAFIEAKKRGLTTILNPAPYHPRTAELLPFTDIITPNETEAAELFNTSFDSSDDEAIETLIKDFCKKNTLEIIVTRGENGVSFSNLEHVYHQRSLSVPVIDTTGAGDTFNGILAGCLLDDKIDLNQAVNFATIGATLSVQKLGAQTAMPAWDEIINTALKKNENI